MDCPWFDGEKVNQINKVQSLRHMQGILRQVFSYGLPQHSGDFFKKLFWSQQILVWKPNGGVEGRPAVFEIAEFNEPPI
jgi:hypothetical protein